MTMAGMRRGFLAAICLSAAVVCAQDLVQVPSQRAITGAPPLYQSQPDREIPGRFVGFTASGCALSFGAAAVRGLTWTGACPGGRMQGEGMVIGYDYEQQPVFVFEGHIERGLRQSGALYEIDRKDGQLIGWRTPIVGSALQPRTEMRFLDLPRPFLLALDDWSFQTDGKDLLASMGAPWAPVRQPAAPAPQAQGGRGVRDGLGTLLGAIGQYQQARQGKPSGPQGSGSANTSGGASGTACTTQNAQFRKEEGYDVMLYSPFECIRLEWRAKPGPRYSGETGRQGRIVNSCPCHVTYQTNGGEVGPYAQSDNQTARPGTEDWRTERTNQKPLEVIPRTSCHYTKELVAKFNPKSGMCKAIKCKNGSYGACGTGTAN